jgi:hypothetical protein
MLRETFAVRLTEINGNSKELAEILGSERCVYSKLSKNKSSMESKRKNINKLFEL